LEWSRLPHAFIRSRWERHGYEKARRVGMMAMVGGKRKTEIKGSGHCQIPRSSYRDKPLRRSLMAPRKEKMPPRRRP